MTTKIEHLQALAIHSYYADEKATGLRACEKALRISSLTDAQEHQFRSHRTWYTPLVSELLPVSFHPLVIPVEPEGYSLFNPSIVPMENGWLVNVRSSNYRIRDWGYVIPPEDGEFIRTHNHLVFLDSDLKIKHHTKLKVDYPKTYFFADGLEDIRLNQTPSGLRFSVTLRNMAPWDGLCRIATGTIDLKSDGSAEAQNLKVLEAPRGQHEKNWMPLYFRENEWIYSCNLADRVLTVSEATEGKKQIWQLQTRSNSPRLARGFRGGSQAVCLDYGLWLACVHEVALNGGHRVYEHRFVLFDENRNWKIAGVTSPFVFRTPFSIEFVAGMAIKGDQLVLSFGEMDERAWLADMSLQKVMQLMVSPEGEPA